ncbi:MAG: DUF5131 family protein, partial [Nanoarchaeota archaeon]|nr:DUF5131 family protein [Nanoarchaeota archaeon]
HCFIGVMPDWVICGGETGSGARQLDPTWAEELKDQCSQNGIPFFFKQMTKKALIPEYLRIRQFPEIKED